MTEFHVGDRVHAGAFGEGVVAIVDGFTPYQTLTIDFDQSGRHVVNPSQVRLDLLARGEAGIAADELAKLDRASVAASTRVESRTPMAASRRVIEDEPGSVAAQLRRVIREELGISDAPVGDRWAGGEVILRPGKPGLKEKSIPIEAFFHKIVMARDRLRVLEAKINGNPKLDDADKLELQGYITRIYGSFTTFNVLFSERDEWFVGAKGDE